MPIFHCKIGLPDGRIAEREFESANRYVLEGYLRNQEFHVFSIHQRPFSKLFRGTSGEAGVRGRHFLSFNQKLLVLIRSGIPIFQALDAIIERMAPGPMLQVLLKIREEIKGGSAFSEALEKFPHIFPHLYIASIKAGERTGDLPVIIGKYIAYQKRMEAIKAKVLSASFYPLLLCMMVTVILLFLFLYVIPSFTQVFADAQVQLPLITQVLIFFAEGLAKSLWIWVPLLVALVIAIKFFLRTEAGGLFLDRARLALPFLGPLVVDYGLTGFCRTLSTLLDGGIPLVQAMKMARGTLNNRVIEGNLSTAVQRVEEGTPLASALEQTGFFPHIALHMVAVGESSGYLGEMLIDISDYCEGEVERRLDRLTTLIEPLMMLSIGLLIGGIVVAMFIPIFQLAGTVR
jgi:type IV pilus assembly protein PilC